jgi:hypothetical protein
MKTTQDAKTIIASLAALLALSAPLFAQAMPMASPARPMKPMPGTSGMMQMGGMMQKMQADTKAMDDELDGLVVTMNLANGSDKMDAMAAAITKMAQQRKIMDQKMAAMQKSMMQGMMGGMGKGMMGGMGKGMMGGMGKGMMGGMGKGMMGGMGKGMMGGVLMQICTWSPRIPVAMISTIEG